MQADLSLPWVHMSEGMFFHVAAEFITINGTFFLKTGQSRYNSGAKNGMFGGLYVL